MLLAILLVTSNKKLLVTKVTRVRLGAPDQGAPNLIQAVTVTTRYQDLVKILLMLINHQ